MRKSNEEVKSYLLKAVAEMEYTHTYAIAIREGGMVKACILRDCDAILPSVTYCERNAESHGGVWGVRMLNTVEMREILKAYADEVVDVCTVDYMEQRRFEVKGNRGNIFEEELVKVIGGYQVEKKNAKFTESGDIVVNGEHIQCKLWNATITTEPTIKNFKKALDKQLKI